MTVLANTQISQTPGLLDFPFVNLTGSDIPAGTPVQIDTTSGNQPGVSTNEGLPITPVAAVGNVVVGFTMADCPSGDTVYVRTGGIVAGICDGSVAANAVVDASNTASRSIKSHTAGKAQCGIALCAGVDGDTIPVLLALANNA